MWFSHCCPLKRTCIFLRALGTLMHSKIEDMLVYSAFPNFICWLHLPQYVWASITKMPPTSWFINNWLAFLQCWCLRSSKSRCWEIQSWICFMCIQSSVFFHNMHFHELFEDPLINMDLEIFWAKASLSFNSDFLWNFWSTMYCKILGTAVFILIYEVWALMHPANLRLQAGI